MNHLAVLLFLAFAWGAEAIQLKNTRLRKPILTYSVCGFLLSTLVAQLIFPQLLLLFRRDASRIFAGDWWRIATALIFQDGGLVGGITNIVTLFWIGSVAEQVRSRWAWLFVGFAGALFAECSALWWQPLGAGNSVFTCSLAGSLLPWRPFSGVPALSMVLRVAAILLACSLVISHDLHGTSGVTGIVLGVLLIGRASR
jgi:hypothetical protein